MLCYLRDPPVHNWVKAITPVRSACAVNVSSTSGFHLYNWLIQTEKNFLQRHPGGRGGAKSGQLCPGRVAEGMGVFQGSPKLDPMCSLQRYSQSHRPHGSRPFHDLPGTIPEIPISCEWSWQLECPPDHVLYGGRPYGSFVNSTVSPGGFRYWIKL